MTFLRTTTSALALSLASAAPLFAQTAPPSRAPSQCLGEVMQYRSEVIKAAQSAKKPVDGKALTEELGRRVKECLRLADTTALDRLNTVDYGRLKLIDGDTVAAIAQFDKAADSPGTGPDRAQALLAIVRTMTASPHAEEYLKKLDNLPDAASARFDARRALMGYYANFDIDDKLEATATSMIALARTMPAADQQKIAGSIAGAYRSLASTYANRLHPDSSLAILRAAPTQQPNLPNLAKELQNDITRYEMIGKQAPALSADTWVNAAVSSLKDTVSIVLFTAHWCHSCRDSYPTLKKLMGEMGGKSLRTVLAIQLDGAFEGVAMNAEQEVAANRSYYANALSEKLSIALQHPAADPSSPLPTNNLNAFRISALPTFMIVDKKGTVRAILTGWDPYGNRARALSAVVTTLANAS